MILNIPHYSLSLLHEGTHTLLYRAFDQKKQQTVIIKILKDEHPSQRLLAQMRHEYTIMQKLDCPHAIKCYGIENFQDRIMLILEDFQGESLASYLKKNTLSLQSFLEISKELAQGLAEIHHQNIIHKDIKPDNIVVNFSTGEVKIIDFGISTLLTREIQQIVSPSSIEGTLEYISPEQTGRMNRVIDYRTDIYSLGITLYEMIAKRLPFKSSNSLELIHYHIAKNPIPPHDIDPSIPNVLSKMILKCLSKDAEDRYHSSYGLKNDIEECLKQLSIAQVVTPFEIGQHDVFDQFHIPQKLYGREAQIKILLDTLERSSKGQAEALFFSGKTGIGKTSLVQEIQKTIIEKKGYYVSGKYDQFKRNIPYLGLIQAFQSLIQQVLSESDESFAEWRQRLQKAVGPNGQLIVDVIPELALIIGKQRPVAQLDIYRSENRFKFVFTNFIKACLEQERPLVIFLDNLQWADLSSIDLLQYLMSDISHRYFMIIGAYRDSEVDETHPLTSAFINIKNAGGKIHTVEMQPISLQSVQDLINDAFYSDEDSTPLAQIVYQKTHGNPFFVVQLLKMLYQNQHINFDPVHQQWKWDLAKIQSVGVTDNVADLLAQRLITLPQNTQNLLKVAAAIGPSFDLFTLAQVSNLSLTQASKEIWPALESELIFASLGENDLLDQDADGSNMESGLINRHYAFQHDRIQQMAYQLIKPEDLNLIHIKIGRSLLANASEKKKSENLIVIASHINYGIHLIKDKAEREEYAYLNFEAGEKAKYSNAYSSAVQYFKSGTQFLAPGCWEFQYNLCFALYENLGICEYLSGDRDQAEKDFELVLSRAKTLIEKCRIYEFRITAYANAGLASDSLASGIKALQLCRIYIPVSPSLNDIFWEKMKLNIGMAFKKINKLKNLKVITDATIIAIASIYNSLLYSALQSNPLLIEFLILKSMNLLLRYGLSETAPVTLARYGNLLVSEKYQEYEKGYQVGIISEILNKQFPLSETIASARSLVELYLRRWGEHIKTSIPQLRELKKQCLESGLLFYSSATATHILVFMIIKGEKLDIILEEAETTLHLVSRNQTKLAHVMVNHLTNVTLFLKGSIGLQDVVPLEMKALIDAGIPFYDWIDLQWKVFLHYFKAEYDAIPNIVEKMKKYEHLYPGQASLLNYYFYHALSICVMLEKQLDRKLWLALKKYRSRIRKWAKACPENHLHKYYLITAEIAALRNRFELAVDLYLKSIEAAKENGFLHEEGLANERLALLYLKRNQLGLARFYMQEAYRTYAFWGSSAKLRLLQEKYGKLLVHGQMTTDLVVPSLKQAARRLGINPILQALQTTAEDIVLDSLSKKIIQIISTIINPDTATLMLAKQNELVIRAQFLNETGSCLLQSNIPIEEQRDRLCLSLIETVRRNQKEQWIKDATIEEPYRKDAAINKRLVKSILVIPLINQNKLIGIIYLENFENARKQFTEQHAQFLLLLAPQIAISIENALLYDDLKAKVEERTKEIKKTQNQLVQQKKMASFAILTGGVAHEIQNPLNFVINFSSLSTSLLKNIEKLLQDENEEPDEAYPQEKKFILHSIDTLKKNMEMIKDQGARAGLIVKKLLEHLSTQSGEFVSTPIYKLIEEVIDVSYRSVRSKDSSFQVTFEKHFDATIDRILISPKDISRVLTNILNNCYHALDQKKKSLSGVFQPFIAIYTRNLGQYLEIRIRDNGIGMPPHIAEKIFTPFFTTKPISQGIGLGLSLSKNVVAQQHGGTLTFQTQPGEFTEFIVNLPIR